MRRLLFLTLLFGCGALLWSAPPAALKPDARKAVAFEYMEAAGIPGSLERSIGMMLEAQKKMVPEYEKFRPALERYFRKLYSYEALRDELAELHLSVYSEKELRELTAFFRTPAGRKKAANDGNISVGTAKIIEQKAAALTSELAAELKKIQSQK